MEVGAELVLAVAIEVRTLFAWVMRNTETLLELWFPTNRD